MMGCDEDVDLRSGRRSLAGVSGNNGGGKGTAVGVRARDRAEADTRGWQQVGGDGGRDRGQRGGDGGKDRVAVRIGGGDADDCGDGAGHGDGDGRADGVNGTL